MEYIDRLISLCKRAKQSSPVKEILVQDLSQLEGIKNAIYVIEEIGGDIEKTFRDCKNQKESDHVRAYPKLNQPSQVMYVGSSTTGVKKRIEQHLGDGSAKTYALHLKHWFEGEYKITVKVYDEPINVLQILEDALSYELQPAFGKRGGNNK